MSIKQMLQAAVILESIGLIDRTTNKQLAKGTLFFSDPKDPGVKYGLYANGYYRKYVPRTSFGGPSCYQLNRQTREKTPWGWSTTGRILIPGEYVTMATRIIAIAQKSRARAK